MDPFTASVLAAAALATLAVAVAAVRRPVLWRLGVRNALRRPKQTLTVVAGLMVGTAIISSALVANDSARAAVRGYVYQSLGEVDASVAIQGYPFFPATVHEGLAADPAVRSAFDGVAAHTIWQGTGEAERTGLFEPSVSLVGFDPAARGFGSFRLPGGGTDDGSRLGPGEAIATKRLADALGIGPGDRVTVSYVLPLDPILPEVTLLNGTASDPGPALPGLPPPAPPPPHPIEVKAGATVLAVLLPPDPRLAATLTAPNGTAHPWRGGLGGTLNVTPPPGRTLPEGTWSLAVGARGASGVAWSAVAAVGYPVYDASLLQERAAALRDAPDFLRELVPGLAGLTAPRTATLTVALVADGGRADLFDLRNALFLRLDGLQALLQRQGQVNLVVLSQPGDAVEGEEATDAALPVLGRALAAVQAAHPGAPSVPHLEVKPLKREFLTQADAKGSTLTGLLVFAASLSIITGLLLILNIFTMLAEERRAEMGMARAVGLSRADLVRLSVFEGSLYAVAAAALGALLGLGLAYAMVGTMNAVVARLSRDISFPPIEYRPSLSAFLVALGLGALLTLATILVASRRQARLNVVRAIRRLDEPERWAGRRGAATAVGLPLALLGVAGTAVAWVPASAPLLLDHRFTAQVALPLVAALGASLALRPRLPRRRLVPLLAGLLAAYWAATFFLIREFDDRGEANIVGPIRGVLMTLAVVAVVVHLERPLRAAGTALARLKPLRALALPALSYPLHRKFRTGMTLAMFSVVLLSIGFFSIFGALFQTDPARQTGGFAVEARTTLPGLASGAAPVPGVAQAVELLEYRSEDRGFLTVNGSQTGTFRDYRHAVYGYGPDFAAVQEFALVERLAGYPSDAAAYQGVLDNPGQVIVSYIYSTSPDGQAFAHHAGDVLEMHLGDETVRYTIAGVQEQYHFPGVFLPKEEVDALFPSTGRLTLYRLDPGADAQAVARQLEATHRAEGMDARSTVDEVLEEQASFRQLLGAMKLFLGLGLVVGVLSLGIVTSRSVLERRQEIGMMRALGYTGRQVRRVFFLEVTATILIGTLVGIACAVVVTYGLWFAVVRELNYPYVVPWAEIGVLVLVSYVVAIAATWAPIGRTAKVAPAEALRYTE